MITPSGVIFATGCLLWTKTGFAGTATGFAGTATGFAGTATGFTTTVGFVVVVLVGCVELGREVWASLKFQKLTKQTEYATNRTIVFKVVSLLLGEQMLANYGLFVNVVIHESYPIHNLCFFDFVCSTLSLMPVRVIRPPTEVRGLAFQEQQRKQLELDAIREVDSPLRCDIERSILIRV